MGRVLVVGATGVLAPAVPLLLDAGHDVVAVARTAADLAALSERYGDGVRTLVADATLSSFDPGRLDGAILYGPATSAATVSGVVATCDGPVVQVLTSAAADPGRTLPPAEPGVRRLLLGWTADGRWHDAAQISRAAVDRLLGDDEAETVLGVVRPWSGRPG